MLLGREQGLPIVYVMTWYEQYPVGVATLADSGISSVADLKAAKWAPPVLSGASYIGLRALLAAADLQESNLGERRWIGFAAAENLCEEQVEASVVYIANEPLTIERQCTPVNLIRVSDYATLCLERAGDQRANHPRPPGSGARHGARAWRGVEDVIADPSLPSTSACSTM